MNPQNFKLTAMLVSKPIYKLPIHYHQDSPPLGKWPSNSAFKVYTSVNNRPLWYKSSSKYWNIQFENRLFQGPPTSVVIKADHKISAFKSAFTKSIFSSKITSKRFITLLSQFKSMFDREQSYIFHNFTFFSFQNVPFLLKITTKWWKWEWDYLKLDF